MRGCRATFICHLFQCACHPSAQAIQLWFAVFACRVTSPSTGRWMERMGAVTRSSIEGVAQKTGRAGPSQRPRTPASNINNTLNKAESGHCTTAPHRRVPMRTRPGCSAGVGRLSHRGLRCGPQARPMACSMMPFWACMRFSAWSKMIEVAAERGACGEARRHGDGGRKAAGSWAQASPPAAIHHPPPHSSRSSSSSSGRQHAPALPQAHLPPPRPQYTQCRARRAGSA